MMKYKASVHGLGSRFNKRILFPASLIKRLGTRTVSYLVDPLSNSLIVRPTKATGYYYWVGTRPESNSAYVNVPRRALRAIGLDRSCKCQCSVKGRSIRVWER